MARLVALLAIVCCLELASAARSTILAGQTWTIRGDKAGTADSASQNPSVDAVPKAPVFPNSYEMEYDLVLPYVETTQPGGLKYPVHVWWDGPGQRIKVDVYGGLDSSGFDASTPGVVRSFNAYPRIETMACDSVNGSAGPTLTLGAWMGLGDGESSTPLPDISGWTYAGSTTLNNAQALVWQYSVRHGEKTATYTFYTAPNGWPLKLYMMGVNLLTGSHFDEYILLFRRFRPGPPANKAFAPPPACAGHMNQEEGQEGPRRRLSLGAQILSLLPSSRMGLSGPFPSATLASLRASAQSAMEANARLVAQHNAAADAADAAAAAAAANTIDNDSNSNSNAPSSGPLYRLSLNHFAHLTHDQWAATSLGHVPRAKDTDVSAAAAAAAALRPRASSVSLSARLGTFKRKLTDDQLPASVDWRGTGADGPGVKDQASCGSCWAFSAVGVMQAAWWKATGQALSFSEQQMVDCSWDYENNGCAGGNVEPAIQYIVDSGGAVQEGDYPYAGQNTWCRGPGSSRPVGTQLARFKGYVNVPARDEGALMEAVATHGPVAVVLNAGLPPFKFYAEGVYHNEECHTDPDHMDHAVLLVGYGTTAEGVDYWLIKNSWSKYWGMDGYARITRKGNDCGITTDPVLAVVEVEGEEGEEEQQKGDVAAWR